MVMKFSILVATMEVVDESAYGPTILTSPRKVRAREVEIPVYLNLLTDLIVFQPRKRMRPQVIGDLLHDLVDHHTM